MKVLFVGPSLAGVPIEAILGRERSPGIDRRGPARQGDVIRAVFDGAVAIGLIDGGFEAVASVWHKEILFALAEGVHVVGAASMGALRAAECQNWGMVGVGAIYRRYATGDLDDDAAVALVHAPAEFDYAPLTEAWVDIEATVTRLLDKRLLSDAEASAVLTAARATYFKERSYERVVARAVGVPRERRARVHDLLMAERVDLKRQDAIALVQHLDRTPLARMPRPIAVSMTATFRRGIDQLRSDPQR